jgi:hypothetical protein
MFRRRGSMRPFRRRFLSPDIPPLLQRANELMAIGNYAAAATAFEQLARGSEGRFPERTPFLFLEAGRAALLAGQTKTGVAHFRRGLTLLASQGRHTRMRILGRRLVDELSDRNLTEEAAEITDLIGANQPPEGLTNPETQTRKPLLPTHCPNCGGPIRPDEVEWLDEATAECAFCGSPVRGDS